jgi:hypothetical protein
VHHVFGNHLTKTFCFSIDILSVMSVGFEVATRAARKNTVRRNLNHLRPIRFSQYSELGREQAVYNLRLGNVLFVVILYVWLGNS